MIAGTDFEVVSETANGVSVNCYYMGGDIYWGEEALDAGVKSVAAFENAYGEYPYPELDIVETYLDAGGMEYPNLVMIADELQAEGREDSLLKIVVAHEAAHQWFYGIVGDNQFTEAWLDESFASYSELVYKESYMSSEEIRAEVDGMEAALNRRGFLPSRMTIISTWPMTNSKDLMCMFPPCTGAGKCFSIGCGRRWEKKLLIWRSRSTLKNTP